MQYSTVILLGFFFCNFCMRRKEQDDHFSTIFLKLLTMLRCAGSVVEIEFYFMWPVRFYGSRHSQYFKKCQVVKQINNSLTFVPAR